jgi:hypothetical protein
LRGGAGSGCGFSLEFGEGIESTPAGAAGGIEAVLKFGEGGGVAGGGLSEGVLLGVAVLVVVLVSPGLGFGGAEAAESPLAVDEVVDEAAGIGGGGAVVVVEVGDELVEVGEVLGGEGEGFGVDAGFKSVHGRCGFACDRGGAGGLLGIAAVSFNLPESRHRGSWNGDRRSQRARACPALRIEEGFQGFGG